MSAHNPCTCKGTRKERMKNWGITQWMCNHSAFNGYHHTSSDYSAIRCLGEGCLGSWRSKADYVGTLPMLQMVGYKWVKSPLEEEL